MPLYEGYKLVRLRYRSVQVNLADFLREAESDEWDGYEEVVGTHYYDLSTGSPRLIGEDELEEARRELTLEANAMYGDPDDRAAEELLDSDSFDVEREGP